MLEPDASSKSELKDPFSKDMAGPYDSESDSEESTSSNNSSRSEFSNINITDDEFL